MECARYRTHHYPINSTIRIGLDDRFLDPISITSTVCTGPVSTSLSSSKSSADLAQLKFNTQSDALLARELGIRATWREVLSAKLAFNSARKGSAMVSALRRMPLGEGAGAGSVSVSAIAVVDVDSENLSGQP
jgi:hypothetical protein